MLSCVLVLGGVFVCGVVGQVVASQWRVPHRLHGKGGGFTTLVSLGSVDRLGQVLDQCPICPQLKHAPGSCAADGVVFLALFGPGADCRPWRLTRNSSLSTLHTVLTMLYSFHCCVVSAN